MNKLIQGFVSVIFLAAVIFISIDRLNAQDGTSGTNTLTIYNWGDYIDPLLIKKFENKTGIKVIYQTFDSNEAMMTKIEQGGAVFDVCVPSEYAVEKMLENKMLVPLDYTKLDNFKNIDERFVDLSFDPENKYSIPYFWGTVGIVYNRNLIDDKEILSWNDLWAEEFANKILLIDGAREIMGFSLNSLGYSLNDTNKDHLKKAKEKLDKLRPNVKAIVGDEIKMLLANNEAAIGIVWSGDAAEIMDENEDMEYVIPEEGSNLWFDNLVIPKTVKNLDGAHLFINFMLDAKNAAQNAEYVGYATPNKSAYDIMDEEIIKDETFYPKEELTSKLEVYENIGKRNLGYYNELFLQFKMHTN